MRLEAHLRKFSSKAGVLHLKQGMLTVTQDAKSFTIVAHTLTEQNVEAPSQTAPLLDQIADGAYDGIHCLSLQIDMGRFVLVDTEVSDKIERENQITLTNSSPHMQLRWE